MKKSSSILWGIALIAVGIVVALNALEITNIDLFFDGWWTLFIIVPCVIGLFTGKDTSGNLIGIAIGVVLFLLSNDFLEFALVRKLLIPLVVIVVGIRMLIGGLFGNQAGKLLTKMKAEGKNPKASCATFSSCNVNYSGEVFDGAELTAVFGGIKCDLRNAIILENCAIQATAIFGGIDILAPANVTVKVNSTSIFGGISNKAAGSGEVTLYISGTCLFGGVDVK